MGKRQYYIHVGDMFVTAGGRRDCPCWYDVVCIVRELPQDKYETFQITIRAFGGSCEAGSFRVSTRIRRRSSLLYSIAKYALSSKEFEELKLRFLVECGTTLEGKIKEGVERLRKYPNRYRVKIDPDIVITNIANMKSKQELRRKV